MPHFSSRALWILLLLQLQCSDPRNTGIDTSRFVAASLILQDCFKHSWFPGGHNWCAQTESPAETKFLRLPPPIAAARKQINKPWLQGRGWAHQLSHTTMGVQSWANLPFSQHQLRSRCCGHEASLWLREANFLAKGTPNVFPTPATLPARLHLPSCHFVMCFLIPSCTEAPPSTVRQWSSPQIADSLCLQKHAPSLGGGREEVFSSVPNTHPPTLQGCHGSKESSLKPQSSYWLRQHSSRALSPAVALCPSPCAHTHFPLHTDAAQLTRGQAAGVSKPPKGRPGKKAAQGQAAICGGTGSPSHQSIPPSKEQHCLPRWLHRRHLSLASWWCNFKNKLLSAATLPPHSCCRAIFNHQQHLRFLIFPWEDSATWLKATSPFLELQVPVGLSKIRRPFFAPVSPKNCEKIQSLELCFSPVSSKNGTGIEAEGRWTNTVHTILPEVTWEDLWWLSYLTD